MDESRNLSNFKQHAVWFEEAQTVWADSKSIEFYLGSHSTVSGIDDAQFIRIGRSSANRILLVFFSEQKDAKMIRILAARETTVAEKKHYEERI